VTPQEIQQFEAIRPHERERNPMAAQQFTIDDLMDLLVEKVGLPAAERRNDPAATFPDLGLDSLAFMELQAQLDSRYGVELPDDRAQSYTMSEITASVNDHLAKQGAA
jgi:acyl carrier protein